MTTKDFKEMLLSIGFQNKVDSPEVYTKNYGDLIGVFVSVDFKNRKIYYPDSIKVHDETTSNFEHPENFVVCECVCRLLEKGYRPEHIELEKRWNLGHEAKGGKADICVYDADGQKMLLIIECKTYGTEYIKEKKQTLLDGGQLFSYWQQERSTQWLALYAVDFREGKRVHEMDVISCKDDANVIELAKKDDSYRLYKDAGSNLELYEVWDETYNKNWCPDLIFSEDSTAYQINIRPLRKRDLKEFKAEDKIVNRFEEILRHNNVSDKENAFNRLTALFICKMVDEIGKTDDDELEFQYKEGTDTYETLQDRLQKLHKQGMQDFMRETIFYIPNDYPDQLLKQYAKQKRQAMINDLRNTIRILKFYSNNDFSFKDVHNEELFLQNGKVLVEVVKLFERYRIVYNSKEQFLGDLFEQLLNKGFKQNEGQFFTPIPITRFIWDSLPLESVIQNVGKYSLPKVIDFACGAGHFLTEAVEAINDYLDRIKQPDLKKDNAWVEKSIFGIEKDYRLARVSKISLFMNGAGFGNVIFGDGLDNYPDKGISAESFDVLVANPPYSVAAFKQHFKPKNNKFELLGRISNAGSEIEVLFVERISQLLKPKGLAAVILPASIFSKSNSSYIGAREYLLENFKIRAIVQLGSETFGATDTETVVLFLEKYDEPPKRKELVKDSAFAIQKNEDITDWEDQEIFNAYLANIDVSKEDYKSFCSQNHSFEHWRQHSYFGQYVKSYEDLAETKKKKTQKSFKKLPEDQQTKILTEDFYQYVLAIENEKIRFFALVYDQTSLVVTMPIDNKKQKEFLGYNWSDRKGAEGIHVLNPGGKMYCEDNRYADDRIATVIRSSFLNPIQPPPGLEQYCVWHNLQDMIDFSRVEFNKEIKPAAAHKIEIASKWPIHPLGSLSVFSTKRVLFSSIKYEAYITTDNMLQMRNGVMRYSGPAVPGNVVQYKKEDILVSNIRPYLRKIWYSDQDGGCSPDVLVFCVNRTYALPKYLYYVLSQDIFFDYMMNNKTGKKMPRGDKTSILSFPIPLPPLNIQQKVVEECDNWDTKWKKSSEKAFVLIKELYDSFELSKREAKTQLKLSDQNIVDISIGRRVLEKELQQSGDIVVYSANVKEPFGYIDKLLIQNFEKPSVLWGIDGDWIVNIIPAGQKFYPTDHCGVVRIKRDDIVPEYFMLALENAGKQVRFSRTHRASTDRVKSMSISLPPKDIQERIAKMYWTVQKAKVDSEKLSKLAVSEKQAILDKWLQ